MFRYLIQSMAWNIQPPGELLMQRGEFSTLRRSLKDCIGATGNLPGRNEAAEEVLGFAS